MRTRTYVHVHVCICKLRLASYKMADEIGSMAGRMAGKAALKAFINPSLDIIKVIPQGIIELVLRGAAVVSLFFLSTYYDIKICS